MANEPRKLDDILPENCPHDVFDACVDVHRLEDSGRFSADVRIKCRRCGVPFRFIGLPAGLDLNGAATSADATEARLAIAPKGQVVSIVEGAPQGFSIRKTNRCIRCNKEIDAAEQFCRDCI